MRKHFSLLSLVFIISACSTTPQHQHFHCLASVEQARTVGQEIFYAGFNERVANRLGMQSGATIVGLGLAWDGFDPKPYCDQGAPLIVKYDPNSAKHDPEQVMFWSKMILNKMLKQRGYSAM